MAKNCKVCSNAYRLAGINAALDRGISAPTIAAENEQTGWPVTPETIRRHRSHYESAVPAMLAKTKRDFAIMVQERAAEQFESGDLDLRDKHHVPGINSGLKAQSILDKRAQSGDDRKTAFALGVLLAGGDPKGFLAPANMRVLDDGRTIDGEFSEVE